MMRPPMAMAIANPHSHQHLDWNLNTTVATIDTSLPFQPPQSSHHFSPSFSTTSGSMEVDVTDNVPTNPATTGTMGTTGTTGARKRKAETVQESERLCKRVSLLNLEQHGERLYIPVESPSTSPTRTHLSNTSNNPTLPTPPNTNTLEETMRLDDTAHKVYIYDLDAELTSSSDSDSEYNNNLDGGNMNNNRQQHQQMLLLPDLEKHLRATRIPNQVLLRADDEGMFAGKNAREMQIVLYGTPTSLTVPAEQDSVRMAVLEARARARDEVERVQLRIKEAKKLVGEMYPPARDTLNGMGTNRLAVHDGAARGGGGGRGEERRNLFSSFDASNSTSAPARQMGFSSGFAPAGGFEGMLDDDDDDDDDDDAMDLDM